MASNELNNVLDEIQEECIKNQRVRKSMEFSWDSDCLGELTNFGSLRYFRGE